MPSEKCFRRHFLIADMLTDDDHADVARACLTVVLSALQRLLVEVALEAGNTASARVAADAALCL
ncbi:TPA: hypothetical protein ACJJDZ_001918 [Neisseria meningitidis]